MTDTNHIEVLCRQMDTAENSEVRAALRAAITALSARASAGEGGHVGNEWADMAANGVQWLRNIRDGISTADEALAEMESNARRITALAAAPQPASPATGEEDSPQDISWWVRRLKVQEAITDKYVARVAELESSQPAAAQHWSADSSFYKDDVVSEQDAKECFKGETLSAAPQPQEKE